MCLARKLDYVFGHASVHLFVEIQSTEVKDPSVTARRSVRVWTLALKRQRQTSRVEAMAKGPPESDFLRQARTHRAWSAPRPKRRERRWREWLTTTSLAGRLAHHRKSTTADPLLSLTHLTQLFLLTLAHHPQPLNSTPKMLVINTSANINSFLHLPSRQPRSHAIGHLLPRQHPVSRALLASAPAVPPTRQPPPPPSAATFPTLFCYCSDPFSACYATTLCPTPVCRR